MSEKHTKAERELGVGGIEPVDFGALYAVLVPVHIRYDERLAQVKRYAGLRLEEEVKVTE